MILKSSITTLLFSIITLNLSANEEASTSTSTDKGTGQYIIFLSEKSALDTQYNDYGIDRQSIVKSVKQQQARLIKTLKAIDNEIVISSKSQLIENSIHIQLSHHAASIIQKNENVINIVEVPYGQKPNVISGRQGLSISANKNNEDVTIAIIGNGIDYTHAKLGGSGKKSEYQQAKNIKNLNWQSFSSKTVVGGMNFSSVEENNNPIENSNDMNVFEGFYPSGTVQAALILEQAPDAKMLAYKTTDLSWQQLYPALELVIDPNQDGILNDSPDILFINFSGNNNFDHDQKLVNKHIDKISNLNIALIATNNQTGALLSNISSDEMEIPYSNIIPKRLLISKSIKGAIVGSGNETKEMNLINGYFAAYFTGFIAQLKHDAPKVTIKELKALLLVEPAFNKTISEVALLAND